MKYIIKCHEWIINDNRTKVETSGNQISIQNTSNEKITFKCSQKIKITNANLEKCSIKVLGECFNSGGFITINELCSIPIDSECVMPIKSETTMNVTLTIAANSKIILKDVIIDVSSVPNLVEELDKEANVLIIVPDYPSYVNLYSCAFAHSRNKEYLKKGLKIQVFATNDGSWYQVKYDKGNVPVLKGTYQDLKEILAKHQYQVIVTHFVDEYFFSIFDGNIYDNQKLIFICHGPETIYRFLTNRIRPYFTAPLKEPIQNETFDLKDFFVKKYAQKDNVEWVFVSSWLKEISEKEQNIVFKHARVINNIIDEDLFPYVKKNIDDRKKILVVRKFDNISQHSIDQVVLTILELSRRSIFKDLEFDIYGDGDYYDELVEPIKNFANVHLYKRFVPNEELKDVYQSHGIMLIPSRHDTQGVSMCEAASSGCVPVGTNTTAVPYFMNEEENHTLASYEDYVGLADIIERLYNNPEEFLKISANMAQFMKNFNKENTVFKEIELIKESLQEYKNKEEFKTLKPAKKPILTIGIPAYNVSKYIAKCLISILNAYNSDKIEILVINDGSTDDTVKIVKKYEKKANGIVRLINKENGGHGSTINRAIKEATGKYFRLIDGDDWVDSNNLAKLIEIMEKEDSDIILTKGSYDYVEEALFEDIIKYDSLKEGYQYNFEDLVYDNYGFSTYGPLLTTGNYKTELLRKTGFTITEKKPYVDMEFNSFSIKLVKTLTYYNLDIYRYLIGRVGQTISPEYWKGKYKDHEYIIFNILDKVYNDSGYSPLKRMYVLKNIISSMVDSQIFMYDTICKWEEIDEFLAKLKKYPEAYDYSMKFIEKKDGNCRLILHYYKNWLRLHRKTPIIIPEKREKLSDVKEEPVKRSFKGQIKRVIKAIMPYGLLVFIRRWREK